MVPEFPLLISIEILKISNMLYMGSRGNINTKKCLLSFPMWVNNYTVSITINYQESSRYSNAESLRMSEKRSLKLFAESS